MNEDTRPGAEGAGGARPSEDDERTVGPDRQPGRPDETTDHTAPDDAWPHTFDTGPAAAAHGRIAPGGVVAGRYALVERLGEGGMGEVWAAQQTEPVKRKVALKLIKMGLADRSMLARFEQERQALALMDHPNIAKVLDGGVTAAGEPYFVMELVHGQALTRYCDEAKLTTRQRLELFIPICLAVQHAHNKGVIHRDLKPSNVLVTTIDGKAVPKVIDFGVAKAVEGRPGEGLQATQSGAVVGTLEYMSPEQAGYSGTDVDTRADVYSLGVILYELLTGLRPVDAARLRPGAGLAELLRIIHETEPSKPSTRLSSDHARPALAAARQTEPKKLLAHLRGELDWVVMKCLEKSRERRYETADALARDVGRFLADEPVEARPPSASYRFGKMLRRNRPAVVATALVAAALLVGTALATWQAVRATRAEGEERAARQQAVALAEDNARLADDERDAKNRATRLAEDNAKLAADERSAKVQALDATREKERQLGRARANLLTSQLTRAAAVSESDPGQALDLLYDIAACPIDLRDAAWRFAERACNRRLVANLAQPADVIALSPDGTLVAAARPPGPRTGGQVSVLEVATGKARAELPPFADAVTALAFRPDGKSLAVVADGRPSPFGPKGKPGKVVIWDVAAGKPAVTLEGHKDRVTALAFSPDGNLVATGGADNAVRLWDARSGKERRALPGHAKAVAAVAFSPDGKRLASGGLDNAIKLWQVESGELEATLAGATNPAVAELAMPGPGFGPAVSVDGVVALGFSPDGATLAAGNSNWLVELWDVATGKSRAVLRGPSSVRALHYHPDGRSLLVSAGGGTRRYDAATGQVLLTLRRSGAIGLSKAGRFAHASLPAAHIEVLDLDAPVERATLPLGQLSGPSEAAVFSGDGTVLAAAGGDRVFLWDMRTGQLKKTLQGHKHPVRGLAVSPDGRTLASSSAFHNPLGGRPPKEPPAKDDVRLWDLYTGEPLGTIAVGEARVPSLAFSPDGATLATISWRERPNGDGAHTVLSLWDVRTRRLRVTLETRPVGGFSLLKSALVAFSRDGTLAAAAGREIALWDVGAGKVARRLTVGGLLAQVCSLAFRPGGGLLAAGVAFADVIELWSPKTGEVVARLRAEREQGGSVEVGGRPLVGVMGDSGSLAVAFTPDGQSLASADARMIRIWDVATAQQRAAFSTGAPSGATAVAMAPDGLALASLSSPGGRVTKGFTAEVKLWDLGTTPLVAVFAGQHDARFSPDGKSLAVRALPGDGLIHVWDLQGRRPRGEIKTGAADVNAWAFSPDGRTIATGGSGGTAEDQMMARMGQSKAPGAVHAWDVATGAGRGPFEVGRGMVMAMSYSPDGKTLALVQGGRDAKTGRVGSEVTLWDVAAGRAAGTVAVPDTFIRQVAFSPDGGVLALGSANARLIVLHDLKAGKALPPLKGGPGPVAAVGFTRDGARLVSHHATGPTTAVGVVWDWRSGKVVEAPIPGYLELPPVSADGRYRVDFSPGARQLIDLGWRPAGLVPRAR